MRPVGHTDVVNTLEREVPAVSLFTGPASVGKWTVARWALRQVAHEAALLSFPHVGVKEVREVRRWFAFRPTEPKAVVLRLDGASEQATGALLKTLEEPPASCYVAMVSGAPVAATVASRTHRFALAYLSTPEVVEVLRRLGYTERDALARAGMSGGTIQGALQPDQKIRTAPVTGLLRSVGLKDTDAVLGALLAKRQDGSDVLGDEQVGLIRRWACERVSERWRTFTEADTFGMTKQAAHRIFEALGDEARPRIALKRALLSEMS